MTLGATHDPNLMSWVESANGAATDFPIQNLPFVTFEARGGDARLGVAIGDCILDVRAAMGVESMTAVLAMPQSGRAALRGEISRLLSHRPAGAAELLAPAEARLLLPCVIGDYTDFYASLDHATNVGRMFRPDNPLMPNYKWLPVAYHGRASSIVASGAAIRRPWGQFAASPGGPPEFAPTRRLDYELELGAILGPGNPMDEPIPPAEAAGHIAGVCLLNDWSARDIQAWEYQPLGPFLAKSFATSISPYMVTMEALEPFRRPAPPRAEGEPPPLPHLGAGDAFAITLEAWLRTPRMAAPVRLSRASFASMYWTLAQMVAHHASNGCPIRPGDLIGSGTVSGPRKENRGCLLELTLGGAEPLDLGNGETRRYLEDGDEVILHGYCEGAGFRRVGLGECRGVVIPALPPA
jgi:fumarylacetoacetase